MGLRIDRKSDLRAKKCLLHRVADIPGGVTISVATLGGSALFEGTPFGVGSNGMYEVVKTAQILADATATATTYEVAKGHHFKVGDYFATEGCNGQTITLINKSDASKDVITVSTTLGAAITANTCAFASAASNKTPKVTPLGVVGSNEDVEANNNLFVSAWVIGVVKESNAPVVNSTIKNALKGVVYV